MVWIALQSVAQEPTRGSWPLPLPIEILQRAEYRRLNPFDVVESAPDGGDLSFDADRIGDSRAIRIDLGGGRKPRI